MDLEGEGEGGCTQSHQGTTWPKSVDSKVHMPRSDGQFEGGFLNLECQAAMD